LDKMKKLFEKIILSKLENIDKKNDKGSPRKSKILQKSFFKRLINHQTTKGRGGLGRGKK
jgi:hypothetical protein